MLDMRICPTCRKARIPFENGRAALECIGPCFDYRPNGKWWEARYGRILWAHFPPVEDDDEVDLPTTLDRYIINGIRAWWLKRTYQG